MCRASAGAPTARIEGLNPDVWDEERYVVIDPDINTHVGRIYSELIHGERK
jgi:hypothetical protein